MAEGVELVGVSSTGELLDELPFSVTFMSASSLSRSLHLQQRMQGAATSRMGEATTRRRLNPAKIPMT